MQTVILKRIALSALITIAVSGNTRAADIKEINFNNDEAKAAYGIGYNFAKNLQQQANGLNLSPDVIIRGVLDGMNNSEMKVSSQDVQTAIQALQKKQMEIAQSQAKKTAELAHAKGKAYRDKNGKRASVTTTQSGLQYEVLKRGNSNNHPSAASKVRVHYHGTLIDGSVFDSSVERGQPSEFPLNGVIAGWTEGVQLMSPGDKFRFVIPSELAYGDRQASPKIPPGSTLIFDVELLDIL